MNKKSKFRFLRRGTFWFGSVFAISAISSLIPGLPSSANLFGIGWFMALAELLIAIGFVVNSMVLVKDSKS